MCKCPLLGLTTTLSIHGCDSVCFPWMGDCFSLRLVKTSYSKNIDLFPQENTEAICLPGLAEWVSSLAKG